MENRDTLKDIPYTTIDNSPQIIQDISKLFSSGSSPIYAGTENKLTNICTFRPVIDKSDKYSIRFGFCIEFIWENHASIYIM